LPNGLRVGLFGLLVEMVKPHTCLAHLSHFTFEPPLSAAQEVISHLRPSVDVLICLSHLGLAGDRGLAERVKGLDLIVGGHSHTPLERPMRVGSTWIAQAAPYLQAFGRIDLSVKGDQVDLLEGQLWPLR
jgi:2',3'-cyclic-nucleotide 2'-phosphodiesterase (5'-nucleotidase family)